MASKPQSRRKSGERVAAIRSPAGRRAGGKARAAIDQVPGIRGLPQLEAVARTAGDGASDTVRDRILDVAEQLFAARGVESVTLRDVTAVAGVNLAAVHYHLGSRDELLRAILARRMTPLLKERQRRLALLPPGGSAAAKVDHIVRSFVEPTMDYDCSGDQYLISRLMSRLAIYEQRHPTDVFQFVLAESHALFLAALSAALPGLDRERLGYRFEFMLGLVTHATALRTRLLGSSGGIHGIPDAGHLSRELVATIVAIFCAE